jgi:hypothetical protein
MEPPGMEALLAWRIFQGISKLSDLLFRRYEEEFQDFDLEEEAQRAEDFCLPPPGATEFETRLEAEDFAVSFPWERSEE